MLYSETRLIHMWYTRAHMRNPWIVVGAITILLFIGAILYSNSVNTQSNEGVTVTGNVEGNVDAAVTLVEYSDFQCPACSAFQPVLKQVLATYGDQIRFEYKHYPLPIHNFAMQAAVAAEAAGQQGKFFEFHDVLFEKQKEWSVSATPNVLFITYAQDLGLDVETFKRHQKSSLLREKVRSDMNDAKEKGLTGTPTFYLNGEKMEVKTFEDFVTQIALAVDPTVVPVASSTVETQSGEPLKFGL